MSVLWAVKAGTQFSRTFCKGAFLSERGLLVGGWALGMPAGDAAYESVDPTYQDIC